jgi:calcium-dependent protein kinase
MQSTTGREDIRLIDFGLAKVMPAKRVRDREKVGTYTHMAPEVLRGVYSTKCDVWSAGIALCCLATGINPFKKGKKEQTFENILNGSLIFDGKFSLIQHPVGETLIMTSRIWSRGC